MSHILATAAKASLYANNNGTGRDTYISFNNGGNTSMYVPNAKHIRNGRFHQRSFTSVLPNQGQIPAKTISYDQDGTGRDGYIMTNSGGFKYNFDKVAPAEYYVKNLRHYDAVNSSQREIARRSKRFDNMSPQKDFFVEGQLSIRTIKNVKAINQLS